VGRPGDLGTSAALWCEVTAGAAEQDGRRDDCEGSEGKGGIGFFLRSRPQGDKAVRGGARGGSATWAAHGGQEEQVARGGPAGTTTQRWRGHDRRSIRMHAGRCWFERVRTVALDRAQFTVPNRFPFIQITSKLYNSNSLLSQGPKIFKLCKVVDLGMMNNFVPWLNFQFPLYLML
jgi:hypothetical protein